MHEMSLAQSVAEIIEAQMAERPDRELLEIELTVGERAGVELDTFRTAMEAVVRTTRWPRAIVTIVTEPAAAECLMCGTRFHPEGYITECPSCGSGACGVTSGTAFRLTSLRLR